MRKYFAAFLLLASQSLLAATPSERVQAFTRGIDTLSAQFEQRSFDANNKPADITSGTVALKAPRQFRWQYQKPYVQLIVADGDHIWVYDPDLEQVSVRAQSYEEQSSPLAVLIDPAELERQFIVKDGGRGQGLDWVTLTPKKPDDAQISQARLGFKDQDLVQMEFADQLGQRTQMSFTNWQRNPALAAGAFNFTPPKGVDVVGEMREAAVVNPVQE